MKQFDSLCDAFNIEGVDDSTVSNELLGKEEKIPVQVPDPEPEEDATIEYKGQKYTLKSLQYMKATLQEKISQDTHVLETLGQMCKLNSQARYFEVYATLSNTVAGHLKQLQDLEKIETDYQVTQTKEEMAKAAMEQKERMALAKQSNAAQAQTLIQNNTTNLYVSSTELDEMIEKAEEDTHINTDAISTEFDLS